MRSIAAKILSALSILFLSACATAPQVPQLPTVVTLPNTVSMAAVKAAALETYFADGWNLERESEHMLVFVAENTNFAARVLLGTQYDTKLMYRENFLITQGPNGVTMRVNQAIISNYGSAFEKATPVDGRGGQRLQKIQYAVQGQVVGSTVD